METQLAAMHLRKRPPHPRRCRRGGRRLPVAADGEPGQGRVCRRTGPLRASDRRDERQGGMAILNLRSGFRRATVRDGMPCGARLFLPRRRHRQDALAIHRRGRLDRIDPARPTPSSVVSSTDVFITCLALEPNPDKHPATWRTRVDGIFQESIRDPRWPEPSSFARTDFVFIPMNMTATTFLQQTFAAALSLGVLLHRAHAESKYPAGRRPVDQGLHRGAPDGCERGKSISTTSTKTYCRIAHRDGRGAALRSRVGGVS